MTLVTKIRRKSQYDVLGKGDYYLGLEIMSDLYIDNHSQRVATFKCFCGDTFIRTLSNLKRSSNPSCETCSINEVAELKVKHDQDFRELYYVWKGMNYRCNNPKADGYRDYGGRGITVCERWSDTNKEGLHNFGTDMGERLKGLSIERVDVNGNYQPDNCVWADQKVQMNNVRSNHTIYYEDIEYTISELSYRFDINPNTLLYRIRRGWSVEEAVQGKRVLPWKRPYIGKLTDEDFNELLIKRFKHKESLPDLKKEYKVDTGNLSRMFRKIEVLKYYEELTGESYENSSDRPVTG
tara:strand:- start:395 stop:1279 length:885 start_codon:yes stop_codon:yes gene_type:complete